MEVVKIKDLKDSGSCEIFVERFAGKVIGQPGASDVARLIYKAMNNPLRDRNRPLGVFALIGPSRTGKSLTARALASLIHNDEKALVKLNCGDYTESHQVLEIKGAPPSYAGYQDPDKIKHLQPQDEDGTSPLSPHNLARARRGSRRPVNIVLLDEFEKGHRELFKIFMSIFDDGQFTFGNGITADYSDTVFILSMNLGMDKFEQSRQAVGFKTSSNSNAGEDLEIIIAREMRRYFKPEFRNRIDRVVVFKPHDHAGLLSIVRAEVMKLQMRILTGLEAPRCFLLTIDDTACEHILRLGDAGDAAAIKRVMEQTIVPALDSLRGQGDLGFGDRVTITVGDDGDLAFNIEPDAANQELYDLLPMVVYKDGWRHAPALTRPLPASHDRDRYR
ncbi:MAG: ATP-dependent Clp protease ATP-binding subunit [Cyanobacteria bacterium HKST-UBA02]|nr:ATP-dependent Clp protease ATP-binding subunit [Cyanobacteria bacterium HKST-UBA02]